MTNLIALGSTLCPHPLGSLDSGRRPCDPDYLLGRALNSILSIMEKSSFPHANGMVPYWRNRLDALDDHRSTAELPEEVDIVIIGGGYAGASTAHHLLSLMEPGKEQSIMILEARQACSGATGRNGMLLSLNSTLQLC